MTAPTSTNGITGAEFSRGECSRAANSGGATAASSTAIVPADELRVGTGNGLLCTVGAPSPNFGESGVSLLTALGETGLSIGVALLAPSACRMRGAVAGGPDSFGESFIVVPGAAAAITCDVRCSTAASAGGLGSLVAAGDITCDVRCTAVAAPSVGVAGFGGWLSPVGADPGVGAAAAVTCDVRWIGGGFVRAGGRPG